MSRRVAGRSKTSPRKGKLFGRQKVRLGWRKRKIRDLKFLLWAQAAQAEARVVEEQQS